jgi:hypothetical protein
METDAGTRASGYPFGILVIVVGILLRVVSLVALLLVSARSVTATSGAGAGTSVLNWIAANAPVPDRPTDTAVGIVLLVLAIGLLITSVLAAIGLLRRSQNGWVLAVVTSGAILALDLGWWASGEPRYGSMALNAVVLFYLNQRDLRAYFGDPA